MQKFRLSIFFIIITSVSFAQTEWKLKKDADEIKIYTRSIPNEKLDEYKAVTTIKTSIKNVLQELISAPKYYDQCESGISYHVKKLKDNQHLFYARKDLPWPIKDRDLITLLTVEKITDTKYKLKLESLPNAIKEREKTIRIKKLMGFWLLEEVDDSTKVTQQLFVNPEGSLPAFVTNSLLIKGPFKTFSELRATLNNYEDTVLGK
ncbi:START domain-containing protein [uncultured Winogradskyella sp.]|uniref:START domain-containing protein n=1 Tax=uncultured Winogradskyella sp. TaxID=395353 RepID=UPI0026345F84|nr:START domain-containing protein [uncultured Winogradskyella sp.]